MFTYSAPVLRDYWLVGKRLKSFSFTCAVVLIFSVASSPEGAVAVAIFASDRCMHSTLAQYPNR